MFAGTCVASVAPRLGIFLGMSCIFATGLLFFGKAKGRGWAAEWSPRTGLASGALAVWFLFIGGLRISVDNKVEELAFAAEMREQAAAEEYLQGERERISALQSSAPGRMSRATAALQRAEVAIISLDRTPMDSASQEIAALLTLADPPSGLQELRAQISTLNRRLNVHGAEQHLSQAEAHVTNREWEAARGPFEAARPYVAGLGGESFRDRQRSVESQARPYWAASESITQAERALSTNHGNALLSFNAYGESLTGIEAINGAQARQYSRQIRIIRNRLRRSRRSVTPGANRIRRAEAELQRQEQEAIARDRRATSTQQGAQRWAVPASAADREAFQLRPMAHIINDFFAQQYGNPVRASNGNWAYYYFPRGDFTVQVDLADRITVNVYAGCMVACNRWRRLHAAS
jgi:hypothetical protein